jgi:hypothetical protein
MSYLVMVIPPHGAVQPLHLHGKPCAFDTAADAQRVAELLPLYVTDGTRYFVEPLVCS